MGEVDISDGRVNVVNAGTHWNETLFGCFEDMGTCCCGFWCLPCTFGCNAEEIDGASCPGWCCLYWLLGGCLFCWLPHMLKRKALRDKFRLYEEPCNDCLVTACCGPCGICQEARELKSRAGPGFAHRPNDLPVRVQQPVAFRR